VDFEALRELLGQASTNPAQKTPSK